MFAGGTGPIAISFELFESQALSTAPPDPPGTRNQASYLERIKQPYQTLWRDLHVCFMLHEKWLVRNRRAIVVLGPEQWLDGTVTAELRLL